MKKILTMKEYSIRELEARMIKRRIERETEKLIRAKKVIDSKVDTAKTRTIARQLGIKSI